MENKIHITCVNCGCKDIVAGNLYRGVQGYCPVCGFDLNNQLEMQDKVSAEELDKVKLSNPIKPKEKGVGG